MKFILSLFVTLLFCCSTFAQDSGVMSIQNQIRVNNKAAEKYYQNKEYEKAFERIKKVEKLFAGEGIVNEGVVNFKVKILIGLKRYSEARSELTRMEGLRPSRLKHLREDMALHKEIIDTELEKQKSSQASSDESGEMMDIELDVEITDEERVEAIDFSNDQVYPEMISIKGGTFTMGRGVFSAHEVRLSDFEMGKTEVTVAQYRTYCNATGVAMPEEPSWGWHDDDPIVLVSWDDAMGYCKWLSRALGKDITLPSEAQWEYAARGGNYSRGSKFSGGENMATISWYKENSDDRVHAVATKSANELGLHDMTGNVWEWCLDRYLDNYYEVTSTENPLNTSRGAGHVTRGCGWPNAENICDTTYRNYSLAQRTSHSRGFRVVSL